MAHGGAFYTYIVEELPVLMRQFFPLSEKREDNFIAGNSMGGYGAMKIGINNPDRYAAIGCFQPEQMAENLCRITAVCLMIRNGI